jgi:hypothetical protein
MNRIVLPPTLEIDFPGMMLFSLRVLYAFPAMLRPNRNELFLKVMARCHRNFLAGYVSGSWKREVRSLKTSSAGSVPVWNS